MLESKKKILLVFNIFSVTLHFSCAVLLNFLFIYILHHRIVRVVSLNSS